MVQFIPVNLDIKRLIEDYPPNKIENFSEEKLIHILHLLHSIPATNKDVKILPTPSAGKSQRIPAV